MVDIKSGMKLNHIGETTGMVYVTLYKKHLQI